MEEEHTNKWYIEHFEKRLEKMEQFIKDNCSVLEKFILHKIDSLERLLDTKLETNKMLFETKIAATDKATELAARLLEVKLENMNSIRQQLATQRNEFTTKIEHESLIKETNSKYEMVANNLDEKYERVCEDTKTLQKTKANQESINQIILDVKELQLSKANLEGKASTNSVIISYIIAGIGILIGGLGTLLSIFGIIVAIALHFLK